MSLSVQSQDRYRSALGEMHRYRPTLSEEEYRRMSAPVRSLLWW